MTGRESYPSWAKGHPLIIELLKRQDRFDYLYTLDPEQFAIRSTMSESDILSANFCYRVIQREIYYFIQEEYVYPVTPESPQWATMTREEKIAACQIPEETLEHLAPDYLWIAVLEYPLLAEVDYEKGGTKAIEDVLATCNAYQEWLSRPHFDLLVFGALFSGHEIKDYSKDYYWSVFNYLKDVVNEMGDEDDPKLV